MPLKIINQQLTENHQIVPKTNEVSVGSSCCELPIIFGSLYHPLTTDKLQLRADSIISL